MAVKSQLSKTCDALSAIVCFIGYSQKLSKGVKSGIIWHTQGSGKTALAYYSVRSLTDYYAKRETAVKFYFIVDRIALMEQASDEFVARGLVVRNVNSRDDLMKDIRDTTPVVNSEGKAEIMVVNIQKLRKILPKYI